MNSSDDSGTRLAQERTDLAYHRNRWAAERTLMAWIRTSMAMVTFGFAVDQFFLLVRPDDEPALNETAYHWFAFLLVVTGIILLFAAVLEHLVIVSRLKRRQTLAGGPFSLALVGAMLLLLIGAAALVLIVMRPFD